MQTFSEMINNHELADDDVIGFMDGVSLALEYTLDHYSKWVLQWLWLQHYGKQCVRLWTRWEGFLCCQQLSQELSWWVANSLIPAFHMLEHWEV